MPNPFRIIMMTWRSFAAPSVRTDRDQPDGIAQDPVPERLSHLTCRGRVLVVDDSAVVRERLRALLSELDCVRQVNEAANSADAWALFQRLAPDVVLLEIHLADRRGLEILGLIKETTPLCLLIVLTNLQDSIFRQETQRRGADHFLHKATEFERVTELLHRYASHGPSAVPRRLPRTSSAPFSPERCRA